MTGMGVGSEGKVSRGVPTRFKGWGAGKDGGEGSALASALACSHPFAPGENLVSEPTHEVANSKDAGSCLAEAAEQTLPTKLSTFAPGPQRRGPEGSWGL